MLASRPVRCDTGCYNEDSQAFAGLRLGQRGEV